jgi:hypothetical protein
VTLSAIPRKEGHMVQIEQIDEALPMLSTMKNG